MTDPVPLFMSDAAYAAHRGVSRSYISRLHRRGDLVIDAAGNIDVEKSDAKLRAAVEARRVDQAAPCAAPVEPAPLPLGSVDWNRLLPSVASTYRPELHLVCGDAVIFFCPVRRIGMLYRPLQDLAQLTGPVAPHQFVRAMVARGVAMPHGPALAAWSAAITGGRIITSDPGHFLQIARDMDLAAFADAVVDGRHH